MEFCQDITEQPYGAKGEGRLPAHKYEGPGQRMACRAPSPSLGRFIRCRDKCRQCSLTYQTISSIFLHPIWKRRFVSSMLASFCTSSNEIVCARGALCVVIGVEMLWKKKRLVLLVSPSLFMELLLFHQQSVEPSLRTVFWHS